MIFSSRVSPDRHDFDNYFAPENAPNVALRRFCYKGGGGLASIAVPLALTALGGWGGAALGPSIFGAGAGAATLGGAVGGAIGGGLGSAVTGGSVGKGALLGAISGGLGPNLGDIGSSVGIGEAAGGTGVSAGTEAGATVASGVGASPAGAAGSVPSFLGEGIVGADFVPNLGEGIVGAGGGAGAGFESLAGYSPSGPLGPPQVNPGVTAGPLGPPQVNPGFTDSLIAPGDPTVFGGEYAAGTAPTTEALLSAQAGGSLEGGAIPRVANIGARSFDPSGPIPFAARPGFSNPTISFPGGTSMSPSSLPIGANSPTGGAQSTGGVGGAILRGLGMDTTTGIGKILAENAAYAPTVGAIGYQALSGMDELPYSEEMLQQASSLNATALELQRRGLSLTDAMTGGALPAGAQLAIDEAAAGAKASIKSQYARMGMSGSTAERQALEGVDRNALSQRFSLAQQMAQTGIQALGVGGNQGGLASQIYGNLLNAQLREDEGLSSAIADFAMAAAGGGNRGGGGITINRRGR